jgi:hypothetical protein
MINKVLDFIKNEADTFLKLKIKDNRHQYIDLTPVAGQDLTNPAVTSTPGTRH